MIEAALVYFAPRPFFTSLGAACIVSWMFTMLTAPDLTLLFLGVVVGLGTAFVWALWEIEQISKPRRKSDRFG